MSNKSTYSSELIQDLEQFLQFGPEELSHAVNRIAECKLTSLSPMRVLSEVSRILPGRESIAESLVRFAVSVNGSTRQSGISLDDALVAMQDGVNNHSGWNDDQMKNWALICPILAKLVRLDIFRLVATSVELSYEYENLLLSSRILTDIRPIFTPQADAIEGAVISYTLRVRYQCVDGERELNMALDDNDVHLLLMQCERALIKASTAKKAIADSLRIPIVVSGESENVEDAEEA